MDCCRRTDWPLLFDFLSFRVWIELLTPLRDLLLKYLGSCITARRRRRAGFAPYRGTGWAGGRPPPGQGPAQYTGPPQPFYGGNQYNQPPPPTAAPPYSPSNQGYYGNTNNGNQGYFGGQQTGVELQPPQNTHPPQRGGDAVYEPPPGPPPGKGADPVLK
jgi:hypothetical protein